MNIGFECTNKRCQYYFEESNFNVSLDHEESEVFKIFGNSLHPSKPIFDSDINVMICPICNSKMKESTK
jgi:hypothetical protein